MRPFLAPVFGLLVLLAGCVDHAPAYRKELLTFDEGLLGNWNAVFTDPKTNEDSTPIPVLFERREENASWGRLGQYNKREGVGPSSEKVPAYSFTITVPNDKVEEDPDAKPFVRKYDAVLLKLGSKRFLAYQLARDSQDDWETLFGDLLPVHRIAMISRDGDRITARGMSERQIVWLPTVQPLDPEHGTPKLPTKDGVYLVSDPDRLVDALKLASDDDAMWSDPIKAERVKTDH